jgi:hypothetical protein
MILETFQKNWEKVRAEYIEYKEYHDTMIQTIPVIIELLESLFLEDSIKRLNNYDLLVEDYLDGIKRILSPENYQQVKLETNLPDAYDAPRTRRDKAKKTTKITKKLVTETPSLSARAARANLETALNLGVPATLSTANIVATAKTADEVKEASDAREARETRIPTTTRLRLNGTPVPAEEANQPPAPPVFNSAGVPSNLRLATTPTIKNDELPLKLFSEEGKKFQKSPLTTAIIADAAKNLPNKVLIEMPDETKAWLCDDGRILDVNGTMQKGSISDTGKVIYHNSEIGTIKLVPISEKYIQLMTNFGRVRGY